MVAELTTDRLLPKSHEALLPSMAPKAAEFGEEDDHVFPVSKSAHVRVRCVVLATATESVARHQVV
jgi:hypothetical protein